MNQVINVSEVIGIIAKKGWGKTARMTHLLYEDYKAGAKVITNYETVFSDKVLTMVEIMDMILDDDSDLFNASIGLDEIHTGADSRDFLSASNKAFSMFFTQLRKRNIVLYYTTQHVKQIDVRLRRLTDYILHISPSPLYYGDNYKYEKNPIVFYWQLRSAMEWDEILAEAEWDARDFFKKKLYDTNEIVGFDKNHKQDSKKEELNNGKTESKGIESKTERAKPKMEKKKK